MRRLAVLFAAALALSACTTAGQFDPVKTQAGAHRAHAAAAAALQVSAETGALKGSAAAKAKIGLDQAEAAILFTDGVLGVDNDPSVESAAEADAQATYEADQALDKASR